MALFTERHDMRTPIEKTSTISTKMYALLLDACKKYYDNLAWKFPEPCPDGYSCCGLDLRRFSDDLSFEIPSLWRDKYDGISTPSEHDQFDQFALLDLLEYVGQNCRDITSRNWHSYYRHDDLGHAETNDIFNTYCADINSIFIKTGLLFTLTDEMIVERVTEYGVLSPQVENVVATVKEKGIRDLLNEAIALFKEPNPATRNDAVEKLWDAFERMKTYYTALDKKGSAGRIISDMSNGEADFAKLVEDEFKSLTTFGNNFRIRHHETDKIDITDNRHYDYLFNRCLSLIAVAIQYLK